MGLSSQLRIQAEQARKAGEERIARVSAPVSYPDYYEAQAAVTELRKKGDAESLQRASIIESSLSTDPNKLASEKQKVLEQRASEAAAKAAAKEAQQKALEAKQSQYQAQGQTSLKVQAEIEAAKAEYQAAQQEQQAMEAAKQEYITARSTLSSSLSREQQLRQDYLTAQSEKESTAKRETYTETVQVAVLANELPNWKGEANMQKYRPGAGSVIVGYKPVEVKKERVTYDPIYDQKMADIQKQLVETQKEQDTLFAKHAEFNPYTNDEANARFAQLYHSGYSELRAGSSMSGVIGYDAKSKSVQIGAGNIKGMVVSADKITTQKNMDAFGAKHGYQPGATLDPRVAVFNPVDTGILTPGFKAQPHKDIIDHFKANTTTQTTIKLNENLNLSDQTPKEKSMRLEPIRDFIYKAADQGRPDLVIKSGGKTKIVKTEDAYREFVLALRTDQGATIEAPALVSLSESLDISDAKMGLLGFSQDITSKTNVLVGKESEKEKILQPNTFIPLSISKDGELKGFGQYDNKFEMLTLGKTEPKEQPGQTNDFIDAVNDFTKRVESGADNIDSDVLRFGAGAVKDIYLTGPATANLINQFYLDSVEGTQRKEMYVPETSFGIVSSSFIESAKQAAESKDFNKFVLGLSSASTQLSRRADEKGLAMVAGEFIGAVAPIGSGKLSPLKLAKLSFETEKGIKTPIQSLTVGYGKYTVPIVTKADGKLTLKAVEKLPSAKTFEGLSPTGRGLEISTLSPYAQKIITSQVGKKALVEAGIQLKRDVRAIEIDQELQSTLGKIKLKPKIQQKAKPTESVKGAEGEVLIEEVLPTLQPIKGNFAQIVQVREELLRGTGRATTGDIDADYGRVGTVLRMMGAKSAADYIAYSKAAKVVKSAQQKLQAVAEEGREFFVSGTKLKVKEGDKEAKVLELLTNKDAEATIGASPISDYTKVYNKKYTHKKVKGKTEGGKTYKVNTIEDQIATKIASTSAIIGPRTEKFVGEGAPDFLKEGMELQRTEKGFGTGLESRLKDIVDKPILAKEIGLRFKESGNIKEGERLEQLAEEYKSLYPEIDFGAQSVKTFKERPVPDSSTLNDIAKSVYSPSSPTGLIKPTAESLRPRSQKEKDAVSKITGDSRPDSSSRYDSVSSRINETLSKVNGSASRSRDSSSSPSASKADVVSKVLGYGSKSQSSPARSQAKFDSSVVYGPSPAKYGPSPTRYGGGSPGADVVSKITGSPGRQSPIKPEKITPLDIITPKPVAVKLYLSKTRTDKQKENNPNPREDFYASSFTDRILGLRKTKSGKPKDFDYGDSYTNRLVEQDLRRNAKESTKRRTGRTKTNKRGISGKLNKFLDF